MTSSAVDKTAASSLASGDASSVTPTIGREAEAEAEAEEVEEEETGIVDDAGTTGNSFTLRGDAG
jgi:hypothetical protein